LVVLLATVVVRHLNHHRGVVSGAGAPTPMPGRIVAVTRDFELVLIDPTTGDAVRPLAGRVTVGHDQADLAVTPDGQSVYFVSGPPRHPRPQCPGNFDTVMRVDANGGAAELVDEGSSVAVSPDGRWLATAKARCAIEVPGVDLRNLLTGEKRSITGAVGAVSDLSWAPDSRHLAFRLDSSFAHVIDTVTATSLADARCLCDQRDGSRWYGYLGSTGEFLGTASGAVGLSPYGTVVALGSDAREVRKLFTPPKGEEILGLRADRSGTSVVMTTDRGLYRWREGEERPTKLSSRYVDAAWIPKVAHRRPAAATAPPPGVLLTKVDSRVVAMGSSDAAEHGTLTAMRRLRWLSPITPEGVVAAYGTESRNGPCVDPRAEIGTIDLASQAKTRIVAGAIAPTVSPDGRFVAYGILCDGVTLGFSDLRNGRNYRTDPLPSGTKVRSLQDIAPVAWAPDSKRLLYRAVPEGSEDPRFFVGRLWPSRTRSDVVALPVGKHFSAAVFVSDGTLAIASDDRGRSRVRFVDQRLRPARDGGFETPGHMTQLVADGTGEHFLAVTDRRELYRWSVGDRAPTKLADDVTSAAWIPWS
jgi:hypothetical protein